MKVIKNMLLEIVTLILMMINLYMFFIQSGIARIQQTTQEELRLNLPQTVLELLLVDNLVIPRLPLRAGVDANIRFAHITDFPFDGSGRKINDNIVTDLVIG